MKSKKEIYEFLKSKKHIVLATSFNNRVTARTISYVIINDKIIFQTDSTFIKSEQIRLNNKVALCIDNIQIEGIAEITGNHFNECNRDFLEEYK